MARRILDVIFHLGEDLPRVAPPPSSLSHSFEGSLTTFDHPTGQRTSPQEGCAVVANKGARSPRLKVPVIGAPPVFPCVEPHQPEQCEWKPELFLR